ncbi:biotin holocarboxylase synthetase [Ceratobasidium sp. 423]|nr:biotin holocarboxylase synthetase [Ceratobasidium sp. 423]
MPLDVLVYQGPGVSETSLYHTLATLNTILKPNYTVRAVDAELLRAEPWGPSCALLAIPGGRDLPYVEHLAKAIPKIKDFVEKGGAYLGICAGAYFASARVEWEVGTPLQVVGDRALKFFPGTSRGCAYPGFEYESEAGAQLLDITATVHGEDSEQTFEGIYYNGGGVFEGADTPQMLKEFEDSLDKFRFFSSQGDRVAAARKEAGEMTEDETEEAAKKSPVRDIVVYEDTVPTTTDAPLFDISLYFKALHNARGNAPFLKQTNWGVGEVLLYGEVVTSTQTLFDNLAITEACRKVMPGPEGERVRLKWPNDIYILDADGKTKKKIGGILITTNFMDNTLHAVIGSGLNVLNQAPIMSLKQLYPEGTSNPSLTMENIAANIMATFEDMWRTFTEAKGSFEPFMDLYLERWLHSDEQVTLMTTNPPTKVRICGISPDTGFLRTIPERGDPKPIDLQPDGNSFDMMAGLIKAKS